MEKAFLSWQNVLVHGLRKILWLSETATEYYQHGREHTNAKVKSNVPFPAVLQQRYKFWNNLEEYLNAISDFENDINMNLNSYIKNYY